MKITLISFKVACWSLILIGTGHTLTTLTTPKTPELVEISNQMEGFSTQIFGSEITILSLFEGFSLMMGLLLFGFGVLNLMKRKNSQDKNPPLNILIFNVIIAVFCVLLSLNYFFIVPVVFTSIALLGFSISLITKLNNK